MQGVEEVQFLLVLFFVFFGYVLYKVECLIVSLGPSSDPICKSYVQEKCSCGLLWSCQASWAIPSKNARIHRILGDVIFTQIFIYVTEVLGKETTYFLNFDCVPHEWKQLVYSS